MWRRQLAVEKRKDKAMTDHKSSKQPIDADEKTMRDLSDEELGQVSGGSGLTVCQCPRCNPPPPVDL
jgi:hypothetical protein